MSELSDFLLARIAEDEEEAEYIAWRGRWSRHDFEVVTDGWEGDWPYRWCVVAALAGTAGKAEVEWGTADHIARWDPARVLAECEAKRRIIARQSAIWEEAANFVLSDREDAAQWELEEVMQLLALPYADHPDYRQEWKP